MAADKPNHSFLHVGTRYINMNMVTDVLLEESRAVISFSAPMARRIDNPASVVTDTRRLVIQDPAEYETVRRWCSRNNVG